MPEPLVRASFFIGFDAFAAMKGFDFDRLLTSEGLTRDQIADPDNEISLNAAASILTKAAAECADPCLGLHWAEAFRTGSTGVLAYLVLHAKSVRVALKSIVRYVHLHIRPFDISFEEQDCVGRLSWRFPQTMTAPREQYASWAMAVFVIRLRNLAGAGWYPVACDLEHRELPCRAEVERILGPGVNYGCAANALYIGAEVLDRAAATSDPQLFDVMRRYGDQLLEARRLTSEIAGLTRRAIMARLEDGEVSLEDVALDLDLSPRTLQSRLSAAGVKFETLLQETRRDMAEILMRDSDMTLTEIALVLGFSELSAFTRAAGKWFGVTPRARRAELRRAAGSRST